ncbi:hypothetical protein DEDE109153_16455 [Deinococcus deserti]
MQVMHDAVRAEGCSSRPVVVTFAFCPETKVEDDIIAELQRSSRHIPHHFFDHLMPRIVLRVHEIQREVMAEQPDVPVVQREPQRGLITFKLF